MDNQHAVARSPREEAAGGVASYDTGRSVDVPDERHRLLDHVFMRPLLEEGEFINADRPGKFTCGYGARPSEIGPFFVRYGFEPLSLLSSESIGLGMHAILVGLAVADQRAYEAATDLVIAFAADPAIVGLADHLLAIVRRK